MFASLCGSQKTTPAPRRPPGRLGLLATEYHASTTPSGCWERHGFPAVPGTAGVRRSGGHGGGETPGLIPNPVVKPSSADGTARETVWESRTPPEQQPPERARPREGFVFAGGRALFVFPEPSLVLLRVLPRGAFFRDRALLPPLFFGVFPRPLRSLSRAVVSAWFPAPFPRLRCLREDAGDRPGRSPPPGGSVPQSFPGPFSRPFVPRLRSSRRASRRRPTPLLWPRSTGACPDHGTRPPVRLIGFPGGTTLRGPPSRTFPWSFPCLRVFAWGPATGWAVRRRRRGCGRIAWVGGCRRLHCRYERKAEDFLFIAIAFALVCYCRLAKWDELYGGGWRLDGGSGGGG